MNSQQKSFFTTLPGILTGLAALITAIGGLIYTLSESGLIGSPDKDDPVAEQTASLPVENQQGVTKHPLEGTTDGWTIIGKVKQGRYFDLKLMVHGDSPAIGKSYDAVEDFRLVQKRPKRGEDLGQTITLGMVRRGDKVEVLDLYIKTPSTKAVPVWAKLRAILDKR